MSLDEEMLPSWSTMSGNLPDQITVSQRLTSVHIGSSRLDSSVSYPEYAPSPPPRAATAGPTAFSSTGGRGGGFRLPDPNMAYDTGRMQATRPQKWSLVNKAPTQSDLVQPNWRSSGAARSEPRFSPIKKNHTNSSKRELDLFGSRPASPTRARPQRVSEYSPSTKITADGSFGTEGMNRVYSTWDTYKRDNGKPMETGDRGLKFTTGPRGRVPAVSLNSSRIDTMLEFY